MENERFSQEYVLNVANTIWSQIRATGDINVIFSWGIEYTKARTITTPRYGEDFTMASLTMKVNGFQFKGIVDVAYNEGEGLYEIWSTKNFVDYPECVMTGVYAEDLVSVLDKYIETGDMSEEEYKKKVNEAIYE